MAIFGRSARFASILIFAFSLEDLRFYRMDRPFWVLWLYLLSVFSPCLDFLVVALAFLFSCLLLLLGFVFLIFCSCSAYFLGPVPLLLFALSILYQRDLGDPYFGISALILFSIWQGASSLLEIVSASGPRLLRRASCKRLNTKHLNDFILIEVFWWFLWQTLLSNLSHHLCGATVLFLVWARSFI